MESLFKDKNPQGLRVIKTARDEKSINAAVKSGLKPLMKKVEPSSKIRSKFAVLQNKKTSEIKIIGDYRIDYGLNSDSEFEKVIDWTYYYPHKFTSQYAAYLIPADIKIDERVYLEDLIEDYIGLIWNQGDTYRLEGCEAIWNGTDFEILYDPNTNCTTIIG